MIIKIIASVAVFSASLALGVSKTFSMEKRIRELSNIEKGLSVMETEIEFARTPLPEAFKRAVVAENDVFYRAAKACLNYGAVRAMINATEEMMDEEKRILCDFALGLSAETTEGQIRNLRLCKERIRELCNATKLKKNKTGRIYVVSGIALGTTVVILLL